MRNLYITILIFFGLTSNAYAYLDPGTGNIILSAIIASIVAIKTYWYTLIYKFKKFFKKKNKIKTK